MIISIALVGSASCTGLCVWNGGGGGGRGEGGRGKGRREGGEGGDGVGMRAIDDSMLKHRDCTARAPATTPIPQPYNRPFGFLIPFMLWRAYIYLRINPLSFVFGEPYFHPGLNCPVDSLPSLLIFPFVT